MLAWEHQGNSSKWVTMVLVLPAKMPEQVGQILPAVALLRVAEMPLVEDFPV